MRLLWVGKGGEGGAGDEIYDRKVLAALRRDGLAIELFSPVRVSRAREILNLAAGVPHYRTWYASAANARRLAEATARADVVLASWEPFDRLAHALRGRPVIPILHNVTGRSLPALYPGGIAARALAARAASWERRAYGGGRFAAIAVLSRADEAHLRGMTAAKVVYAPPGMPSLVPLAPGAAFRPEFLVSGTYGWAPKRRDVLAFAREFAGVGHPWPVFADPLPEEAEAMLRPSPLDRLEAGSAVRLGVIPDRFEAGYKLKTGFYLAHNAIVLSYADVSADFAGIEDHAFFIRRIGHAREIADHAAAIAACPAPELVARFARFRAACAARFSWAATAEALLGAARAAIR